MRADDKVNRIVGANVTRLRLRRGLTRVALAEMAGMDDSYLGKLERGKRGTSPGRYARLARALGVPLASLFKPARTRASGSSPSHA